MKKMKKVLTLILVLAMIGSSTSVSLGADNLGDVEVAGLLGVLKGDGNGLSDEYLAKKTTRLQAAIMCLRLNGLEDEALQYTGTNTFVDADEVKWPGGKAILAYLKDHPDLGWQGNTRGEITANEIISAQAYTKVMLEALGYKQGVDFDWSDVFDFAKKKGLVKSSNIEIFTNRDIASVTVETLKVNNNEGVKLIDQLILDKVVDQGLAEYCGLYNQPVIVSDIKTAVALNSKVIEVKLTESTEAVDASVFKVKSYNNILSVVSAEIAPWDTDKKTILLNLDSHLTSGELYSVASGNSMANFGGRGADSTYPTVSKSTGVDYNEFILEFSEPIRLDTLRVEVAEKYYNRAALAVLSMEYINSKTIRVMTADQRDATLYGLKVRDARDLAGNEMKDDDDLSFVGVAKSTAPQIVKRAKAIDYNQIYIEFKTNVDVNTIQSASYEMQQVYQGNTAVQVFSAAQATSAQAAAYDATLTTDTEKAAAVKKGVVLTVDGTMDSSRLYKVVVKDLYTLYGKSMSSSSYERETTFVGMAKPTGSFAYASSQAIVPASATSLKVVFARKIREELAEDVSNYTIQEAYGTTYSLPIISAVLQDDEKTVKLEVGEMKGILYKLTTKNMVDIYGNSQKTGQDAEKTFVGQLKEAKISKIKTIIRVTTSDKDIKVTFDAKVGSNAKDVALYSIDKGVGYPEAVTTYSNDPYSVKLTLPKTTETVSYKLTVKGLYNADGVAMDSSGIYGYFTGKGIAKGLPVLQAAMSLDKHTVKLYFDRDVTSSTIKGVLWAIDGTDDKVAQFFQKKSSGSNAYIIPQELKAYQDSKDKNALVVVDDDASWTTGNGYTYYVDLTTGYDNKKVRLDTSVSYLEVVARDNPYTYPIVEGIIGVDDNTVKLYFTKPIYDLPASAISIKKTSNNSMVTITREPIPVNGTNNMQWLIPVDTNMEYVSYMITIDYTQVSDKYLVTKKLSTHADDQKNTNVIKEFAGNGTDANYISNVYAMMKDDRTIEVYYPENMYYQSQVINNNTATSNANQNVDNINSYLVRQIDGHSSVPYSTPVITHIAYDDVINKATLYLDRNFHDSISTFGLVVNTHVANITRNKTVAESSTSNNPRVIEVVNNKNNINRGPAIQNAVVSGDRVKLTVTMDSVIAFGDGTHAVDTDSVYDSIDEFVNKTTDDTGTATPSAKTKTLSIAAVKTDLLKALKIATTFVGESEGTVDANDIQDVTIGVDGKTLVFTFKKTIAAGANGYVTTKTGNTTANTDLYNYSIVKRSKTDYESMVAFAAPNSSVYDYTDPRVAYATATQKTYSNGEYLDVVLTFTEYVTISDGNKDSKISLTINGVTKEAHLYSMTANTATFRYQVEAGLVDTDGIDVVDDSLVFGTNDYIRDYNGNNLVVTSLDAAHLTNVNVDSSVLSVSATATPKTYVQGEIIDVTLTFNKNVTITDTNKDSRITLIIGGVEKQAILFSTATNTAIYRYTVENALLDAGGIDVKDNSLVLGTGDSIVDASNSNIDLTILNLTNLTNVNVDSTALSINNVSAVAKTYGVSENIDVTLTFNKDITLTEQAPANDSKIVLIIGTTEKDATLLSVGTNTAIFRYEVEAGLSDTDDVVVKDDSLTLGIGDTIRDSNANDLNLSSLDTTNLINVKVDSAALTNTGASATAKTYVSGEHIDVVLTFNKNIVVTDTNGDTTIKLQIAGSQQLATYRSSATNTATFRYTVTDGLLDTDNIEVVANSLIYGAGDSIKDGSNNALDVASVTLRALTGVNVDSTRPTIGSTVTVTGKTYKKDDNIDIQLSFSEAVTYTDDNKSSYIVITVGTEEKYATLLSKTPTTATYQYIVEDGKTDSDGIVIKADSLHLGDGDSIVDVNNNPLDPALAQKPLDTVLVDGVVPTVTDITATGKTYGASEVIDIVLTFNENVAITDANKDSTIKLAIDSQPEKVAVLHATTPTTATYRYVVEGNIQDANGIDVKANSLTLNAGDTIIDAAGNPINANFVLKNLPAVIIDSLVPAVMSVTATDGTYTDGNNIDVVVTFSEDITFTDNGTANDSTITLILGTTEVSATYLSYLNNTVTFRYAVTGVSPVDTDGIAIKVNSLTLNTGDTIKDVGSVDATLTTLNLTHLAEVKVQP